MRFVLVESQLTDLNPGRPEIYRTLLNKIMIDWPLQLRPTETSLIAKACELEKEIGLKKNLIILQTNNYAIEDAIEQGLGNPKSTQFQTMMINSGMLQPCFEMGRDDHWTISVVAVGLCLRNLVSEQIVKFMQLYSKSKSSPKDRQELLSKTQQFFGILRESLIYAELKFHETQRTLELREADEGLQLSSWSVGKFDVLIIDTTSKQDFRDHAREYCERHQVSFDKIKAELNLDVIMEI